VEKRLLYITSCWPHARAFGGQLRTLHIGRALQKVGKVTLAVVDSDAPNEEVVRKAAAEFCMEAPVRVNEDYSRSLGQRLRRAFDPTFLNVHGCSVNSVARDC
jgi:hypothetical protein